MAWAQDERSTLESMARTSARLTLPMDKGFSRLTRIAALGAAMLCFSPLPHAAVPARAAVPGRPPEARCLPDGSAYLRARLRGALSADLDWRNAGFECEGGMRPDGHGIRVSFAGPLHSAGTLHELRFIFGIAASGEGRSGRALPVNVTLILEGERRIFSTRGDKQCTIDELRQEPLGRTPRRREYRVAARGFCVGPATSLTGSGRVLVSRFDFSGRITLYTDATPAGPRAEHTAVRVNDARRPVS